MRRAVFLDRDGVLNRAIVRNGKPYPPNDPSEVEVLPGAVEACASLRALGFLLIVVTNQPDVARGAQRREVVEEINATLRSQIPLDDIRVCYHDDPDGCRCRKPHPGLLTEAAHEWGIDLRASYMVGDRWRDTEAGQRAGCRTVFIDYEYSETQRRAADHHVRSLAEAAQWIAHRKEADGHEVCL